MSYSANETGLKVRNSKNAIMLRFWKDQFQKKRVSAVKPIMFRSWKYRLQYKMLNSND